MFDRLLRTVAPHPCSGCGNVGNLLCSQCKYDITSEPFERCLACLRVAGRDNLCDPCRQKYDLSGGWCVGLREGALKELLNRYKFDSAREAADICCELLDERLPVLPDTAVFVPVPTASAHQRQRGFDHTGEITKRLARRRGLRSASVLRRCGNATQHFQNKAERQRSAQAAIAPVGRSPKIVVLVDDIYTTGATLLACAGALKRSGAEQVYVAIIARQTLDEHADL